MAREDQYDLWIGDEAGEIDYFLHEEHQARVTLLLARQPRKGVLAIPEGGLRQGST